MFCFNFLTETVASCATKGDRCYGGVRHVRLLILAFRYAYQIANFKVSSIIFYIDYMLIPNGRFRKEININIRDKKNVLFRNIPKVISHLVKPALLNQTPDVLNIKHRTEHVWIRWKKKYHVVLHPLHLALAHYLSIFIQQECFYILYLYLTRRSFVLAVNQMLRSAYPGNGYSMSTGRII